MAANKAKLIDLQCVDSSEGKIPVFKYRFENKGGESWATDLVVKKEPYGLFDIC
jgi:hypothetical protein